MYAFAIQTAAVATDKGIPVTITAGEIWEASDPIVKTYPSFFADEPTEVKRTVAKAVKKTTARK